MSESPRQTLPVGTRIGVYEIRRVLGVGQTGITYQAWNKHLNTEMVLREYFPCGLVTRADDACTAVPILESDQALFEFGLERFLVEAEDLISMEHPSIVRVQNSLQIYDTAYQIMEYEKGVSLEKLIERPEALLDEDQLRLILLPILDALEKVHRVGFVHGDINPRNILLKADGEPVLLNFASTRLAMARSRGELTEVLNEAYAPPEQFEALDNYGPQTDLYALGTTMYYCIMGKPPVPGRERLSAVNRAEPDPQGPIEMSAAPSFSEGFLRCIDTMMDLKVDQRPKSATEVVEKLSVPSQEDVKKIGKTAVKEVVEKNSAQTRPTQDRSRLLLMAVTALGVIALITTVFWYSRQDESRSDLAELENTGEIIVADRGDALEFEQIGSKVSPSEGYGQEQEIGPLTHEPQSGNSAQISDVALEPETGSGMTQESAQSTVPDPIASTIRGESDKAVKDFEMGVESISVEQENQGLVSENTKKEGHTAQHTPLEASTVNEVVSSLDEGSQDFSGGGDVESESKSERKMVSATESSQEDSGSDQMISEGVTAKQTQADEAQVQPDMVGQQDDLEDLVAKRMASAEADLAALRLTTPKGENAMENYRAILDLLPNHSGALAGMQRIVDIYVWMIDNAISKGGFAAAKLYLDRAEEIIPGAPSLVRARRNLNEVQISTAAE